MTPFARVRASFVSLGQAGLLAVAAAGLLVSVAQAQTSVSGAITGDTRWTAANSPYLVSRNVAVQGGATLVIDPGVTVYMASGAGLSVQSGSLRAMGSAAQPIHVLSDKTRQGQTPAPGDWEQWVFGGGASGTRLEHVLFEHGKGLAISGSAPVLNFVDIRNSLGAAIAIDLQASPTGVGNRASGNTLNGIAVPAGDLSVSVRWGLQGIPYLVTAGTVSVGASPAIQGVSPSTVEQGQTLTLTVNGARLNGLAKASLDQAGLTLTPFSGGSSSQAFLQLRVDPSAPAGAANLRLQVDAGEVVLANAVTVTVPLPTLTSIEPSTVQAGLGATEVTVNGRNFSGNSELLFNAASVPTTVVSATQLRGTLPNQSAPGTLQAQVRTPDAARPGQYLLSGQVALVVQAPVPSTLAVEPTPIALPPDGKAREITLRLSKADYRDNTLNLSVSDTSKASVTPSTLVIPAGQTSAKITIVPRAVGTVTLTATAPTLQTVSVPLFITADFRGANTAYAAPVGVVVQANAVSATREISVVNANVGVAVGAVLTRVTPRAWPVGSNPSISIQGVGIPSGAQVTLAPSTGITTSAVSVNAESTEIQLTLNTAADAPVGARKLIVRDAAGKDLVFADPAAAVVQLMTGLPAIDSIEPIFGVRGTTLKLLVRGRHLQQGQLRVLPEAGIRVDAAPVVSADGSALTAYVEIAADAPTGLRLIQVSTPSGSTTTALAPQNSFQVVSAASASATPVASGLVGVVVGNSALPSQTAVREPASTWVGVLLGTGITEVAPRTGVIGATVPVIVRGAGLQAVTAVSLTPSTGLSVGPTSVNQDGTELSFTVTVDAGATLGARRLVLTATDRPVTFARPGDGSFLISAPVPELNSVEPQVLLADQGNVKLTLRGRNLLNVIGARIEPAQGITVSGPYEANAEGTVLSFTAAVSGAASGVRAVIVATSAGESSAALQAGNMVRIASQLGPTYSNLLSPSVGVVVGSTSVEPVPVDRSAVSAAVGVVVDRVAVADTVDTIAASQTVGVIVGAAAQTVSPNGWLQGASGSINVTGYGLDSVTAVTVVPSTGLLLGSPATTDGGASLTVSISVAPDAPPTSRQLRLSTASGARVDFVGATTATFGIGVLPTLTSVSPIVFEQGKGATLVVRGTNLQGVTRVVFAPSSGVRASSEIVWSQDALGESLAVPISVDVDAALGNRVLRLEVPGGITSPDAAPANTINVVAPQ